MLANILTIFKKDFREVLRERRSLVFMLILPSVVVPLLVVTINFLTQETIEKVSTSSIDIAIVGAQHLPDEIRTLLLDKESQRLERTASDLLRLKPFSQGLLLWHPDKIPETLFSGRQYLQFENPPHLSEKFSFSDMSAEWQALEKPLSLYGHNFLQTAMNELDESIVEPAFFTVLNQIRENISQGDLHAVMIVSPGFSESLLHGHDIELHLLTDSTKFRSSSAASSLVRLLRFALTYNTNYILEEFNIDNRVLNPLTINQLSVQPQESLYLRLLPYFIVLMCFIGALYPAIDLIAGEKERNTLETILICPVSRFEILLGKLLVTILSGFIASLLTFISLSLTLSLGLTDDELQLHKVLSPLAISNYLLMLLPLACLFASLLLTLSTVARNFKEAQSYIMPFNFLILIPAFYALLPGVELDTKLAMMPVLNVTLALRDIWSGNLELGIVFIILTSSTIYSLMMISLCTYLFSQGIDSI